MFIAKSCAHCIHRKNCDRLNENLFKKENNGREVATVLSRIAEACSSYSEETD